MRNKSILAIIIIVALTLLSRIIFAHAIEKKLILGSIDSTVKPIDTIETSDGLINIKNTDDNTNETFIIKSDKDSYYGSDGNFDMVIAVTNLREDEWGTLKLKYSNGERINSVSKYTPVPSTEDIPIYADTQIACKMATSGPCFSHIQTGTTTEDTTIDTWEDVPLESQIVKTNVLQKATAGIYDSKDVRYLFPKGTTVLKLNISHKLETTLFHNDEFFIEIFGDNGGYGVIDPLVTSLVSYWKFDESSGNASDSFGPNTLTNGGTTTYIPGLINNAATTSTSLSQDFEISDASQSGLTQTGDWSIQLWFFYITLAPGDPIILGKDKSGARQYVISITTSDKTVNAFVFNAAGSNTAAPGIASIPNVWNQMILTYHFVGDGTSRLTLYQNGVKTAQSLVSVGPVTSKSTYFGIGSREFVGARGFWSGRLDEAAFWSKELTASEVTSLYKGGVGCQYPFLNECSFTTSIKIINQGIESLNSGTEIIP